MFCENCGNKLPDGAKFCGGCGAKTEPVQPAYTAADEPAQACPVHPQPTRPQRRQRLLISRRMHRNSPRPIPGEEAAIRCASGST